MADQLDQLITVIFSASRKLRERFHPQTSPDGLSMLQLGTLHLVQRLKHPSMSEIAQQLHITRPSATSLIKGLIKSGHLQRLPSKIDRRGVALNLTPKGNRITQLALKNLEQELRNSLKILDTKEQLIFIKILTKLIQENS